MKSLTFLVYTIFWDTLTIGGCAYIVFILDANGWWFVLAVYLSTLAYKPSDWIHGGIKAD